MPKFRIKKKLRKYFIMYFLAYLVVVPLIYFILDKTSFIRSFNHSPLLHILKIVGIALGIAVIVSLWGSRDPELRKE